MSPRHTALVPALTLLVLAPTLACMGLGDSPDQLKQRARMEIVELGRLCQTENMFQGRVPEDLASVPGVESTTDPWGNPYELVVPGPGDTEFDIVSAGPDGAMGTLDDVLYTDL